MDSQRSIGSRAHLHLARQMLPHAISMCCSRADLAGPENWLARANSALAEITFVDESPWPRSIVASIRRQSTPRPFADCRPRIGTDEALGAATNGDHYARRLE